MQSIVDNLLMSPGQAFGSGFWETMLDICTKVFMPFAITILGYCVALEMYNAYCRANGDIDLQMISTTIFKFIIPFTLITRSYDLIGWLFTTFNSLIIRLQGAFSLDFAENGTGQIESIMQEVNSMNFGERMGMWFQLQILSMGMVIMGCIIVIIIYGRLFELMLFWLVSPLPIATLVHNEQSQIGKNFIKMFLALVFQCVLIFLCVLFYSGLSKSAELGTGGATWSMLCYTGILIGCIVKSGSISKRMFGTF